MRVSYSLAATLLGCFAAAVAASAQPADNRLAAAEACRTESDDAVRLACFDRIFGSPAEEDLEPSAEPSPPRENTEADFGGENLPAARAAAEEATVRSIDARVVSTQTTARGKLVFTLDNGQVWRQLDADTATPLIPSASDPYPVTVRRGALGGYRLQITGRRPAVRVRRVE